MPVKRERVDRPSTDPKTGNKYKLYGHMEGDKFVQDEEPYLVELGNTVGENGGKSGSKTTITANDGKVYDVSYETDPKTGKRVESDRILIKDTAEIMRLDNEIKAEAEKAKRTGETRKAGADLVVALDEMKMLYKPEYTGFVDNILGAGTPDYFRDKNELRYDTVNEQLTGLVTKLMSGAAASEGEYKRVLSWVPTKSTSNEKTQESLDYISKWATMRMNGADEKIINDFIDKLEKSEEKKEAINNDKAYGKQMLNKLYGGVK